MFVNSKFLLKDNQGNIARDLQIQMNAKQQNNLVINKNWKQQKLKTEKKTHTILVPHS